MIRNKYPLTSLVALGCLLLSVGSLQAHPNAFKPTFVDTLVAPYLEVQGALALDDLSAAQHGAGAYLDAMKEAPAGDAANVSEGLRRPANLIASARDLNSAREALLPLSNEFESLVRHVGTTDDTPLYVAHCPMAFGGNGADWIQSDKTVSNPYYGKSMLRCGDVKERIAGTDQSSSDDEHSDHDHSAMRHGAPGGQPYSAAQLDALHAGVAGYQSASTETAAAASDCGMSCCAAEK